MMLERLVINILICWLSLASGKIGMIRAQQLERQNVSCIAHDAKFTCDCHSLLQALDLPTLSGSVYQIDIINCPSLIIHKNSIEDTQGLRRIKVRNVQNLIMLPQAFTFSRYASNTPLIIEFEDVHFAMIDSHAISGNIEEISFLRCRVDLIKPFGFTTIKDRAVLFRMDSVQVRRLEPQAFKKFAVEEMDIKNCVFEQNVPSKVFYEIEILNKMQIVNNEFKRMHTRSFSLKLVSKLVVSMNQFEDVEPEWMEAWIRESIIFKENNFGNTSSIAFKGIKVHRSYVKSDQLEFNFYNNTVRCPNSLYPLEFDEHLALNIKYLNYANSYSCDDLDRSTKPPKPNTNFFRTNVDNIYFTNNQESVRLSHIIDTNCKKTSPLLYISMGALVAIALIIAIIVIICMVQAKKRKKLKELEIIQPEPRTYTQTQIVYQIENAGLLKTDL